MSPKRPPRILALDPGTREMGVAVLEGPELVDYCVKTFRNGRKVKELLIQAGHTMSWLLERYKPDIVVIERPFFAKTKRSALLTFLVQELRRGAVRRGVALRLVRPGDVKRNLVEKERPTKRDIARVVIQRYPQLAQHFHPGDFWRERYWGHVFDAVATGLVELNDE